MKDVNTAKTITVRISTDEERKVLKRIISETGCKQVSKALLRTADGYCRMCDLVKSQLEEIKRLKKENQRLQNLANVIINTGMAMRTLTTLDDEDITDEK